MSVKIEGHLQSDTHALVPLLEGLNAVSLGWWALLMSVASIAPYIQEVNVPLPTHLYLFKIACPLVWLTVFSVLCALQVFKVYLSTESGSLRLRYKSYLLKRLAFDFDAWMLPKLNHLSHRKQMGLLKASYLLKKKILYPLAPLARGVAFLSLSVWILVLYSLTNQFTDIQISLYPFLVLANTFFYVRGVITT